jgi:outer membrane protein TolC
MRKLAVLFLLLSASGIISGAEPRSLTFAEAADIAVACSADLRHAYASQNIREHTWMLGLWAYLPKLSLNASENDRLQQIGQDSFMKNYTISVDQLLWDGGKTSMIRKLERMELDLSHSQLGRMAIAVADSALAAYRKVLLSRAVLSIKEDALRALEEQRRILAEEVALGLALQVDLARADVSIAGTKIELVSLRSDLAEMELQFAELLGLETLPVLKEKIDIYRSTLIPAPDAVRAHAEERSPDLKEARFGIMQKEGELQFASRSWIPAFRLTGGFGLSGQQYPLVRHNWSMGLTIEFASPWFKSTTGAQAGWEPPHDKSALLQTNFTPLPDPSKGLTRHQAALALDLEREKYKVAFERTGRAAVRAVEKCFLADQKRRLAVEAVSLSAERLVLEELRLALGQITRIDLMEILIETSQQETAAVEAAVYMLETERELERLLDIKPGELQAFAESESHQGNLN